MPSHPPLTELSAVRPSPRAVEDRIASPRFARTRPAPEATSDFARDPGRGMRHRRRSNGRPGDGAGEDGAMEAAGLALQAASVAGVFRFGRM